MPPMLSVYNHLEVPLAMGLCRDTRLPLTGGRGEEAEDSTSKSNVEVLCDEPRLLLIKGTSPMTTPSKPTWPTCRMSFCGVLIILEVSLREVGRRDALKDPVRNRTHAVLFQLA